MRTSYLITQLVGVSFVHRLRREQKGIICHLVCPIDVGVAVRRHAGTVAVIQNLCEVFAVVFRSEVPGYLQISPWINDSCKCKAFKAADQRKVAFAVM